MEAMSITRTEIKPKKKDEDGITARGNRDLMRGIQEEIQDVEFNDEDNE